MSLLTLCQDAAVRLTGQRPTSIFGSSEQFALELASIASEASKAMARAHDWQRLTVAWTQGGDGTTTSFAMPGDFDRMPLGVRIYSTRSQTPLAPAAGLDHWNELQNITPVVGYPGYWILLGGTLQILPALGATETARSYYQSNQIWSGSKTEPTADTDEFLLSEDVLKLAVIWRWRALKRLEYAEDLRNFEIAFGEAAGRDRGSKVLTMGRARISSEVAQSWPGTITP
jgi:hypothetical protein